jgi:hypothetical protein
LPITSGGIMEEPKMEQQEQDRVIHILWKGPFTLTQIKQMNGPTDKGLYQVYGHHPAYGKALVYIGLTRQKTFGIRIPQHDWEGGSENDPTTVEYYVGRLRWVAQPSTEVWNEDIAVAEALLIHSHAPAYNTTFGKEPPSREKHGNARVINWGAVRSLHREVSGLVWSLGDAGIAFLDKAGAASRPGAP